MIENNKRSLIINNQDYRVDDSVIVSVIDVKVQIKDDFIKNMMKNQEEQKKSIEELLEKQKVLEKVLNSMRGQKVANDELADSMEPLNQFTMRHVFKNVLKLEKDEHTESEDREHFGVPWSLEFTRRAEHAGIFFGCGLDASTEFSIEAEVELKIVHPSESAVTRKYRKCIDDCDVFGDWDFIKWEEMVKKYLVDGTITVEAHINILSKSGVFRKNFRCFDVANEFSDIVLIVNFEKFFVSKTVLAEISPFFYSLFFGPFAESRKSEIVLNGILPADFHNFLQVVYHEPAIDEFTVEGILSVADLYDTAVIRRKCDEFLVEKSEKSLKKKFQLANRYNLEKLKEKCLSEIKTMGDIRSVVPDEITDLDESTRNVLLKKCIAFEE